MATMRDNSRHHWTGDTTTEHIKTGSLQRIADSLEKIADTNVSIKYALESFTTSKGSYFKQLAKRERTKRLALEKKLKAASRCPNDTNNDGDCHLCAKTGGCPHKTP